MKLRLQHSGRSFHQPATLRRNRRQATSNHPEPRNSLPRPRGGAIAASVWFLICRAAAGGWQPNANLQHYVALSAKILDEFLAADVVVVGAPMYNFTIPSHLKAWIDRLLVAGKTFRYSETGVAGLAAGKRVIIASARGGIYAEGTPAAALEHQETYLRAVFAFIGLPDIEVVRAGGIAEGPELKAQSIEAAQREIAKLKAA